MRWEFGNPSQEQTTPFAPAADSEQTPAVAAAEAPEAADSPPPPDEAFNPQPIVLDLSSPSNASAPFVGGWAFSYIVASVFVCLLLLGFWAYKLPSDRGSSIASNENSRGLTAHGASPHARPAPVFVGRVTGIAGAKWSDDPDYIAPLGVGVALGRTYKLKSGLMEITYDSGAKVILEGPCSYEVDSTAGGYLSLGKLVAKVGAGGEGRGAGEVVSGQLSVTSVKEEGGRRKEEGDRPNAASLATSHSPLATNPSPLSPLPSPLFSVRTPTAIVTDLGTEFGVEVAENENTTSHVFEGMVVVQAVCREYRDAGMRDAGKSPEIAIAGGNAHETITLATGESARVEKDAQTGAVRIPTGKKIGVAPKFFRRFPHRGPIRVYSTGQNVRRGAPDPNWYIAAGLNDPNFKPQPAISTATYSKSFRSSQPGRAVWVSTGDWLPGLPEGTVYTFRTTFLLNGAPPAGLELRGGFAADNHVDAIRLNGRPAAVPEHGYKQPFLELHPFRVTEGFVEGMNVLEIDVSNGAPNTRPRPSPMALLVELEAVVAAEVAAPDVSPESDPNDSKQPSDGGKGDG